MDTCSSGAILYFLLVRWRFLWGSICQLDVNRCRSSPCSTPSNAVCGFGSAKINGTCTPCGAGTFSLGVTCIRCQKGTFFHYAGCKLFFLLPAVFCLGALPPLVWPIMFFHAVTATALFASVSAGVRLHLSKVHPLYLCDWYDENWEVITSQQTTREHDWIYFILGSLAVFVLLSALIVFTFQNKFQKYIVSASGCVCVKKPQWATWRSLLSNMSTKKIPSFYRGLVGIWVIAGGDPCDFYYYYYNYQIHLFAIYRTTEVSSVQPGTVFTDTSSTTSTTLTTLTTLSLFCCFPQLSHHVWY